MRDVDPTRARVVLIGTPHYRHPELLDVPQVTNNVADLTAVLTDPALGAIPAANCVTVPADANLAEVGDALVAAAEAAEDLLIVYYSGHGLLGSRRDDLWLSLVDTRPDRLPFTALAFDAVRDACLDSPASNRVIILDSCYSGKAIGSALSDSSGRVLGQVRVAGTYTMTASPANRRAKVLDGEAHTAFTGRLLRLLRGGLPGGPRMLNLGDVYRHLRATLTAEGLPVPEQRGTGTADLLGLIPNVGYRPGGSQAVGAPVERFGERERQAVSAGRYRGPAEGVRMLRSLLVDRERQLGAEHPDTARTRSLLGTFTGRTGDRRAAVELLRQAHTEQRATLGERHPETLTTLVWLGHNTAQAGDLEKGRDLISRALAEQHAILGPTHVDTLRTGYLHASYRDAEAAVPLLRDVVAAQTAQLGADHPDTLDSRLYLAECLHTLGEHAEARTALTALADAHTRVFGADHPDTIHCRQRLAAVTAEAGDRATAERLLAALIPDATRALGAASPVTFAIRYSHARLAPTEAEVVERFDRLGVDQVRLVGVDDPATLNTRRMQVAIVADGQDHAEAYRLAQDLVTDHVRVLGPYHEDTLLTREILAAKAWDAGEHAEAVRLSKALLADLRRVLGPDHASVTLVAGRLAFYEESLRR